MARVGGQVDCASGSDGTLRGMGPVCVHVGGWLVALGSSFITALGRRCVQAESKQLAWGFTRWKVCETTRGHPENNQTQKSVPRGGSHPISTCTLSSTDRGQGSCKGGLGHPKLLPVDLTTVMGFALLGANPLSLVQGDSGRLRLSSLEIHSQYTEPLERQALSFVVMWRWEPYSPIQSLCFK